MIFYLTTIPTSVSTVTKEQGAKAPPAAQKDETHAPRVQTSLVIIPFVIIIPYPPSTATPTFGCA